MDISVNIPERIKELMGEDDLLSYGGELVYTYQAGYEKLEYRRLSNHGRSEYAGAYHPDAVCEGGGVCKWCGRTL